jgi:hypothetical protein
METKLNNNKVLFNKLSDYFKDNVRISLINKENLFIITKGDMFYCIDINNENISSFIKNNDNSVIESMIIKDLCLKQINDLNIGYNCRGYYCFASNEYNIYYYDIEYGVMKGYISEEKIIDISYYYKHSIFLTQSGKVYEYEVNEYERENSEKYIDFKLKSFKNNSFENEKIVMISCGGYHSLALTESGRVFYWGYNELRALCVNVGYLSEPVIVKLNGLKIKKISCGRAHSLLLSDVGNIYAFGWNTYGEIGNGTEKSRRFPVKLELKKKFIDIASHPYYEISMSQSIDGIYYVWGYFEGKKVLSPQPTKYESFEEILISNNFIRNTKTFGKLFEFKGSFLKNYFYSKNFKQLNELGFGSFGSVFKVKREVNKYSRRRVEYSAINKIEFTSVDKNAIIREYLKYKIITRNYSKNEYLVKYFDAWLEESFSNQSGICLYIQMELCDMTLEEAIKEFTKDSTLKTTIYDFGEILFNKGTLTIVGYYIASNIFLQILEGVNHLHKQDPPIIHGALTPSNILLKKSEEGLYVKIADFGLIALHQYSGQWHTIDKGTLQYMAPEVFTNKKYDTKADIYSLGVIFNDLTDFEPDE